MKRRLYEINFYALLAETDRHLSFPLFIGMQLGYVRVWKRRRHHRWFNRYVSDLNGKVSWSDCGITAAFTFIRWHASRKRSDGSIVLYD